MNTSGAIALLSDTDRSEIGASSVGILTFPSRSKILLGQHGTIQD